MRTARLTFYGGGHVDLMQIIDIEMLKGALFGPALTKWYQLLNRIKFATPTRGVIYRVRLAWHRIVS
jgi:protein Mpv17